MDDIVFGSVNDTFAKSFADEMKKIFEMSMVGELTYLLGLQVKQTNKGVYINQAKYTKNIVKRFGLENAAYARTPKATNTKLGIDPSGQPVDITLYRSMIGCLLYLTASHSNISFSVDVCARFQANPKMTHFIAVKKIIKYVSGTCDFVLFYSKESNVSLVRYSDVDWASNVDDRKSTTGGYYYVGTNLVAWMSNFFFFFFLVSLSIAEAKYIAAGSCCSQLLWMKNYWVIMV